MFSQHGSAGPLWDAAKAEVRAVLIDVARKKERISYSKLAAKVRSMNFEPLDKRLVHLLGQIGRDEAACWMKECDAVHAHWSKPGQKR